MIENLSDKGNQKNVYNPNLARIVNKIIEEQKRQKEIKQKTTEQEQETKQKTKKQKNKLYELDQEITDAKDCITSISAAGDYLFTSSEDGIVRVYKREDLEYKITQEIKKLEVPDGFSHKKKYPCKVFAIDKELIVGSYDGLIRIYTRRKNGKYKLKQSIKDSKNKVKDAPVLNKIEDLFALDDFLFIVSGLTLRIYKKEKNGKYKKTQEIEYSANPIESVFALGDLLFTGRWAGIVEVYQKEDGLYKKIKEIKDARSDIVNVHATKSYLFTSSHDDYVRIYKKEDDKYKLIQEIKCEYPRGVSAINMMSDFLIISCGKAVKIYMRDNGLYEEMQEIKYGGKWNTHTFTIEGRIIISNENNIRVYEPTKGFALYRLGMLFSKVGAGVFE